MDAIYYLGSIAQKLERIAAALEELVALAKEEPE